MEPYLTVFIVLIYRRTWTNWWPTSGQLTPTLYAASSPMRPRPLGRWRIPWSCTSCAVTVCWKASGSAGRDSPTGSSMETLNKGTVNAKVRKKSFYIYNTIVDHSCVFCTFVLISDTASWIQMLFLRDSSLITRKQLKNCWVLWISTMSSINLDTQR